MTIVTRFAPSPTGYLHIGGARTALYNWLYAKHMGGKFLIRIEDTDKERNTPEAVQAIYDGLKWLGLDSDEPVVLQSLRSERHAEVARELVRRGAAYLDYTTPDQMDIYRKDWSVSGLKGPFRYQSPWRDCSPLDLPSDDRPYTIRLKAPREGSTTIHDLVQGDVTVQNKELDDMILLRSDGTPTYMLAVVVDDHDMGVTHVIRGDDHLNNAFRQLPIYDGMGWDRPAYAHIPLIFDESGKKLSKRTGAAAVEDYRDLMGILPEAMLNYLARLGWGHGDEEIFTMEQAAEWFDIKNVVRNPARLDKKKLASINGHYIRETSASRLSKLIRPKLEAQGINPDPLTLQAAMAALQPRSADLNALAAGTMFIWAQRPLTLSEPLNEDAKRILAGMAHILEGLDWVASRLEFAIHEESRDSGIPLGKLVAPLRMALTGSRISPPITDVFMLLGKDECVARMKDALK